MRDSQDISTVLGYVGVIWRAHKNLRLGQLLLNAAGGRELFFLEDEDLMKRLTETYKPHGERA